LPHPALTIRGSLHRQRSRLRGGIHFSVNHLPKEAIPDGREKIFKEVGLGPVENARLNHARNRDHRCLRE
jgi:hypothetical protein